MAGLNGVLSMGVGALNASQTAIQTTGNNISNVNTVGYSRQAVMLKDRTALNSSPGQMGQGVKATEIYRYFDKFLESSFLDKNSAQARYQSEYSMLSQVETLFNEATTSGVGSALTNFFKTFNQLSQEPNSLAVREALLQSSTTLTSQIANVQNSMESLRQQMDSMIQQDVDKANSLIKEIALLNREINASTIAGRNNANNLMDQRDLKVRELSAIMDINVQDNGAGDYNVTTGAGFLLVQQDIPYALAFGGNQVDKNLVNSSGYNGTVGFEGTDGYEYTIQVVTPGTVDTSGSTTPPPGTATYRVSLDGGKTWLKNGDGTDKEFFATDKANSNSVKDLQIYFTDTKTSLTAGDSFTVSPKTEVYWVSPTVAPVNISTQMYGDGTQNGQRITGGSLGGYLTFRDYDIGQYMDRMDNFAQSVIWEVNRIHSQGSGLEKYSTTLGTQEVRRTNVALGSDASGFPWSSRLQNGNMSFAIYDASSGDTIVPYPGVNIFSPQNFDPSKNSLDDVVAAINSGPASSYINAQIIDGKLQLSSTDPSKYKFGLTNDTTGLAAGLGINTFFSGSDASTISIRKEVLNNTNLINAGRINGAGEGNSGDNITANEIAALLSGKVNVQTGSGQSVSQSLVDYYASVTAKVGADTSSARYSYNTQSAMAQELSDQSEAISGVSLDEEMTNLIKFQSSYKAAAKLITTADEMLQTLLSLKS